MKSLWDSPAFRREARRRLWVFSDLQQSDPRNAEYCMHAGVDDFLSLPEWLRKKVEASPSWQARDHSNETPPPEDPRGFDELIDEEQLPF